MRSCRVALRQLVVRTDSEQCVPNLVGALRRDYDVIEVPEVGTSDAELAEVCKEASLILHCYTPITENVMKQATKLRGIVKYGVGIDKIDIGFAKQKGVAVANVPEYGENTVAEGAMNLMMSLLKKNKIIQKEMTGDAAWAWPNETFLANDLHGKNVGLVGFGKIGKCFSRMCQGFGMKVTAYDPHLSASDMSAYGVEKADSLENMMPQLDVLSIHTVLNPDTDNLVSSDLIDLLKSSCYVINVSRGAIIDEAALCNAVKSNKIAGIGIDVFSVEPLAADGHVYSSIRHYDNVMFTPHLAFWTAEARQRLESEALSRSLEILTNKPLRVLSSDPRLTSQSPDLVTLGSA
eukprot:TRINITY_DN3717_c1_g1_i2.p1 TRINITY_DN3717_c1_g1~~TRINITY_DN3717_c1_g1_i2.p1  ORF type:complete len:349 (+),score=51.49 TRINITY_DN3717_c1_g1_i2:64-1110(+)